MRTTPWFNIPLRFAILRHVGHPGKRDHFDILLEMYPGENQEDIALMKYETVSGLKLQEIKVTYQGGVRSGILVMKAR